MSWALNAPLWHTNSSLSVAFSSFALLFHIWAVPKYPLIYYFHIFFSTESALKLLFQQNHKSSCADDWWRKSLAFITLCFTLKIRERVLLWERGGLRATPVRKYWSQIWVELLYCDWSDSRWCVFTHNHSYSRIICIIYTHRNTADEYRDVSVCLYPYNTVRHNLFDFKGIYCSQQYSMD